MKKGVVGYLAVIISGILLSLELYGLNFAKYIDMAINGSCYTNAMDYIHEIPFLLSFLVRSTVPAKKSKTAPMVPT